jgi:outer membrane immunogenic protein
MRRAFFALLAAALSFGSGQAGLAADMPLKAPPLPAPAYSWTGFYVGINGGDGWGTSSSNSDFSLAGTSFNLPIASQGISGWLGGFQAGYNWQSGVIVFGVEGDFDFADIEGNTACLVVFNCNVKQDWVADFTGRLGVAPADRLLMYVKGGVAWADDKFNFGNSITTAGGTFALNSSASDTRVGGIMGMGVEYAFLPHWSAKLEYDFIDFGTNTVAFPLTTTPPTPGLPTIQTQIKETESLMKAGLNYRF